MREYASAEERVTKKTENDHPPFWFYGESIRTSVHGSYFVLLWKRHHSNAIVGTNMNNYACDNKSYIGDV